MRTNRGTIVNRRVWLHVCLAMAVVVATGCAKGADGEQDRASGGESPGLQRDDTPKPPPRVVRRLVIPEGTKFEFKLTTTVSSQTSRVGDRVNGVLAEAVRVDETTAIPAGALVRGQVTAAHPLPRIGGRASLAFSLHEIETPDGRVYPIEAMFARTGPSETAKDAATIVAGVVIGAVAGHQVDDDQGRAIGGLAGGGVGTAIAASTEGKRIVLPSGTRLRLTLRIPVPVEVRA